MATTATNRHQFTTRSLAIATSACALLTAMWAVVLRLYDPATILERASLIGWVLTTNGQVLFSVLVWSRLKSIPVAERRDYYTATALGFFPLVFVGLVWLCALSEPSLLMHWILSYGLFLALMALLAFFGLFGPSRVPIRKDFPFAAMRMFVFANYLIPVFAAAEVLGEFL